jgi:hypothetical protein
MPTQRRAYSGSRAMQAAILKLADEDADQPRLRMVKEGKSKFTKRSSPKRSPRSSPKRSSPKQSSPKRSSPKRSSPKRSSPKRSSPKRSSPKRSSPKRSPSSPKAQRPALPAMAEMPSTPSAMAHLLVALRSLVLAPLPKKVKGGFIDKAPTSQLHFLEVLFDVMNNERARVVFLPAGGPPTGQGRFAKARLLLACDPLTPGGACCVFDTMQRRCVRFDTPAASAFWQRCTEHIGAALDLEDKGEEEGGGDDDGDDDDVEHILIGVPSDDHDRKDGDGVGWALALLASAHQEEADEVDADAMLRHALRACAVAPGPARELLVDALLARFPSPRDPAELRARLSPPGAWPLSFGSSETRPDAPPFRLVADAAGAAAVFHDSTSATLRCAEEEGVSLAKCGLASAGADAPTLEEALAEAVEACTLRDAGCASVFPHPPTLRGKPLRWEVDAPARAEGGGVEVDLVDDDDDDDDE